MSQRVLLFVGALVLAAIVLCTVVVVKADAAATPELTAQKTENRWVKNYNYLSTSLRMVAKPGLPDCTPRKRKTGYRCELWSTLQNTEGKTVGSCEADTTVVPRRYSAGYRSKGILAEGCTLNN